jgi:hypothetical protein
VSMWKAGNELSLTEAVKMACEQDSLTDALVWIAVWESDRAVKQALEFQRTGVSTASHGGGWDTCFRVSFQEVMKAWREKHAY